MLIIFASRLAALRAACRFSFHSPAWLESLPVTIGTQVWPWAIGSASHDGRTINKTDDQGICRIFHFGVDSPLILQEWLVEAKRTQALQATGRVVTCCHRREEEDLAQGNVFPRPEQNLRCSFVTHCELFFEQGASLIHRRVAMARRKRSAAWAVFADCQDPIARGVCGEGGTPFRAEVEAFRALLTALQ